MMAAVHPGFLFSRVLQRDMFGLSPYARFRRARERLDAMLDDQIERTRASLDGHLAEVAYADARACHVSSSRAAR